MVLLPSCTHTPLPHSFLLLSPSLQCNPSFTGPFSPSLPLPVFQQQQQQQCPHCTDSFHLAALCPCWALGNSPFSPLPLSISSGFWDVSCSSKIQSSAPTAWFCPTAPSTFSGWFPSPSALFCCSNQPLQLVSNVLSYHLKIKGSFQFHFHLVFEEIWVHQDERQKYLTCDLLLCGVV